MDMLEQYLQLSTRKRETMSDSMTKFLTIYWGKYTGSEYKQDYIGLIQWVSSLSSMSNASKKTVVGVIGRMMYVFNLLSLEEFTKAKDVFKAKPVNWSNKVIPEDVLLQFFDKLRERKANQFIVKRDTCIFLTMALTGCRIGQALALRRKDVNILEDRIKLVFQSYKKNEFNSSYTDMYSQVLPKDAGLPKNNFWKCLEEYLALYTFNQDNVLYCKQGGEPMTYHNARMTCVNVLPEYDITPHMFRHTAISRVVNMYGITKGSMLANHTNINTTKRYVQYNPEVISDVYPKSIH